MKDIVDAKSYLDNCPYNGKLWLSTHAHNLNKNTSNECEIWVLKDVVIPTIHSWHYDDNLLEYGDSLINIPDIFLTRRFRLMILDAEKYLTQVDRDLIAAWNELNR